MELLRETMLGAIEHIEFNEESTKGTRKEIRKKLNSVSKARQVNEDLGVDTTQFDEIESGLSEQLEETAKTLRKYRLIKYRCESIIKIIDDVDTEENEEEV